MLPRRWRSLAAGAIGALLCHSMVGAATIYVDIDTPASPGNQDGLGWSTAFRFLEPVLANASAGDVILIADGTYYPDHSLVGGVPTPGDDRTLAFAWNENVTIEGGFVGNGGTGTFQKSSNPTILSGDLNENGVADSSDSLVVIVVPAAFGVEYDSDDSKLIDLDIRHGYFDSVNDSLPYPDPGQFQYTSPIAPALGVLESLTKFEAEITDCRFEGHASAIADETAYLYGGCVRIERTGPDTATDHGVLFRRCAFVENEAAYSGGAIAVLEPTTDSDDESRVQIVQSTFEGNAATGGTPSAAGSGGAIGLLEGDGTAFVDIVNCAFLENSASLSGGAIGADKDHGSTTRGNFAVHGSLFAGNTAVGNGGAIDVNKFRLDLRDCTLADNAADGDGGAIHRVDLAGSAQSEFAVRNCILFYNEADGSANQIHNETSDDDDNESVSYSCVEGGQAGVTGDGIGAWSSNLDSVTDPAFADRPNGDYRLGRNGPCLNVGSNASVPADILDVDEDSNTTETLPLDLDGVTRIIATVDLGAFELKCGGDADGNGFVDIRDIQEIFDAWGAWSSQYPDADLDGDGWVDVDDLALVFEWWSCGEAEYEAPPEGVEDCLARYPSNPTALENCIDAVLLTGSGQ